MAEFSIPGIFNIEHDVAEFIRAGGGDEGIIDRLAARCDPDKLAQELAAQNQGDLFAATMKQKALTETPDGYIELSAAMDH